MRRTAIVLAVGLGAFLTTARASADPAPGGLVQPRTEAAAERQQALKSGPSSAQNQVASPPEQAGGARGRIKALLQTLDDSAANLEASGDSEAVVEAAKSRASFAAAMAAVDQLSDEHLARLERDLPILAANQRISPEPGTSSGVQDVEVLSVAAPTQADQAELEQLRRDLDDLFLHYGTWSNLVPKDQEFLGYVSDGRSMVAGLTYEDLAALRDQMNQIPNWQQVLAPDIESILGVTGTLADPTVLGGVVADPVPSGGALPGDAVSGGQPAPGEGFGLFGSLTPDRRATIDAGGQCPQLALDLTTEQVAERIIAESVLRYVALALKFGAEIAPKDIKISILGFAVDIPNPYTLLMLIGKMIVNRVADGLAADVMVIGVCTSIVHYHYTIQHAQSEIDRSQDMLFQELEFHNRMQARYNALDLAERELWKLQLQLAVEENLLLDAPKADGSDENRIALFQYTDTVCFNPEELLPTPLPPFEAPVAPTPEDPIDPPDRYVPLPTLQPFVGPPDPREECGLVLVRKIVFESIQHNQQAGQNIHNALNLLAAGDVFLANNNYGQAYIRFRQAYQAAVKPDPSPTN